LRTDTIVVACMVSSFDMFCSDSARSRQAAMRAIRGYEAPYVCLGRRNANVGGAGNSYLFPAFSRLVPTLKRLAFPLKKREPV
jgi:hypothetical protein